MKNISYYLEKATFTYNIKLFLSACLAAIMFVFVFLTSGEFFKNEISITVAEGDIFAVAIYFSLFYFAGLAIFFYGKKTDKIETILFFAAALAALTYIRCSLMYYVSQDYKAFLSAWIARMEESKGISALADYAGDYTVPYQCFLLILSKIGGNDLFFIKFFSMAFDLVGAYFVMKIVELKTDNVAVRAISFLLTLAVPTVFFNSAMWGQCDMMFTSLCLGGLYFALKGKGSAAVIMVSVAFSFKIQTVFFAPVFLVLFLVKKIRWRDLLWFPAVMLISVLPAVFAGKGIIESLKVYLTQTSEYRMIYMNAPSIWRFLDGKGTVYPSEIHGAPFDNFRSIATMLAGFAAVSLVYVAYRYREKLDTRRMVSLAFIGSLMIPFLLPCMHERYFFAADIMSLIYFFYNKKRWYVPIGVIFCSYAVYSYYLFFADIGTDILNASILLVILAQALYEFVNELIHGEIPEHPVCAADEKPDYILETVSETDAR